MRDKGLTHSQPPVPKAVPLSSDAFLSPEPQGASKPGGTNMVPGWRGPIPEGNWCVMVGFSTHQDRKTMTDFARCPTQTPMLSSSASMSPAPAALTTS